MTLEKESEGVIQSAEDVRSSRLKKKQTHKTILRTQLNNEIYRWQTHRNNTPFFSLYLQHRAVNEQILWLRVRHLIVDMQSFLFFKKCPQVLLCLQQKYLCAS